MTAFHPVSQTKDLGHGVRRVVEVNDHEILVTRIGDGLYGVENVCSCLAGISGHQLDHDEDDPHTHGGRLARLQDAEIADGRITCPMHGSQFDLGTGKPVAGMANIALNTYEVRLTGEQVEVAQMSDSERHFWHDEGGENRP